MPSPPALQRPHKSSTTASIASHHNQPQSNSAFPPFPPAPPLQFPSNSIQTNLLLNSLLLRHLQLNNQQQNAGSQQPPQQPSMPPQMFCPNDYFSPVQSQPSSAAAGGAAMFAKTIDSLYNFLSPNVIILPVASHSLPDEQHIQLLGMPQTIIPVALHPHMLRQFPVRPLLVEPGINGGKVSTTAPNQLPILMANSSTNKDDRAQQFHLPISFRHSLFPSPPSSNPPFSSTGNSRCSQIGTTGMAMENCSERERTPPHQQQQNGPKLIGKVDEMAVEDANPIEPLDLSMATAAISSNSLCANLLNKNPQQSRKRGGQNEKKENMNEQQQMQRKRVKSADEGDGIVLNAAAAAFLHPLTASIAPNGVGIIPGIGIAAAAPSKSPTDNSRAGPLSSSIPPKMGADETPKKRFPCDRKPLQNLFQFPLCHSVCGDVSFLALETLEGHKKYYCRNRPRPDPMEASKANMHEHPMAKVPSSSSGNDQQNPIVVPPPILHCHQCAFRAQNAEQLASHERQLHPPSFICIVCGYKAFTIRGLKTHVRLSHGQQQQNLTKLLNGKKTEEKKEGEEDVAGNEKNLNEVKKSPLAEIKQEKIN